MTRAHLTVIAVIVTLLSSHLLVSSLLGLGDAEALYYCYSRFLSLSYLDHPPLIGWLIALTTRLLSPHVVAIRMVPMTMTALSIFFTYKMTKEMFGDRASAWSVLLMIATPVFSVGMVAASPDAPLAALWPLFTWQLHRLLNDPVDGLRQRVGRPILLGGILGLAFLSKYIAILLVITSLIMFVRKEHRVWLRRPGIYLGAVVALSAALPVLLWNLSNGWASVLPCLLDAFYQFHQYKRYPYLQALEHPPQGSFHPAASHGAQLPSSQLPLILDQKYIALLEQFLLRIVEVVTWLFQGLLPIGHSSLHG